jgi:hypothetical protein
MKEGDRQKKNIKVKDKLDKTGYKRIRKGNMRFKLV